nr:PhoH family protein [Atopobiaceae bacterium]
LDQAREVLEGIEGISFIDLDRNDIVRHSLVARIVDAFARGEGGDAHGPRDR